MARSEEAILKRALKRQRSEGEQRQADRIDMYKQQEKKAKQDQEAKRLRTATPSYYGPTSTTTKPKKEHSMKITMPTSMTTKSPPTQSPSKNASNIDDFKDRRQDQRQDQRQQQPPPQQKQQQQHQQQRTGPPPQQQHQRLASPRNNLDNTATTNEEDPMKEAGAWICPKCSNSNFASRRYCNSKTCDEPRPFNADYDRKRNNNNNNNNIRRSSMPPRSSSRNTPSSTSRPTKVVRHDEATSKKLVWAEQADPKKLSKNQELRQRYLDCGGDGMTQEDIDRAKILLARDERKKSKRSKTTATKSSSTIETKSMDNNTPSSSLVDDAIDTDNKNEKEETKETTTSTELNREEADTSKQEDKKKEQRRERKKSNDSKSKRDQNAALRRLYLETNGRGMKPDQIERAKLLIARDERKKQKKTEQVSSKQ